VWRFEPRYFYPFYIIYLFFFFDFIYDFLKIIFKKKHNKVLFFLILIFFIFNLFYSYGKNNFIDGTDEIIQPLQIIFPLLDSNPLKKHSIYINTADDDAFAGVAFVDLIFHFSENRYSDNVLSYLKELEPLYWFQIIDSFHPSDTYTGSGNRNPETDYVICIDCSSLNLTNFDLDFKYFYKESERFYKSNIEKYVVSVYKNKNFNSTKENI